MSDTETFEGWAVLELMGHRRLAGHLSEQVIGGQAFLRIDVPTDPPATQFYSAGAVYAITPTTEETARAAANVGRVGPVQRWELAPAASPVVDAHIVDEDEDEDEAFAEDLHLESAREGADF